MATFYIESGTGKQITDLNQVDPTKSYTQSGTGTIYSGSQLKPTGTSTNLSPTVPTSSPTTTIPPPQPATPLPGVVYQSGTTTPGGGGTSPTATLQSGNVVDTQQTTAQAPASTASTSTTAPAKTPDQNQQPPTPTAQAPQVNLQPGSQDAANVGKLQDYLVSLGLLRPEDLLNGGRGVYGPKTTAAVAQLQSTLGVDNSTGVGYFGPKTISAILSASTKPTNNTQTQGTQGAQGSQTTTDTQKPVEQKNIQEVYAQMYKDSGIGDIKSQYEKTLKEQEAVTNELNDKILDIKNDPWLSQGVQDKQIEQLQKKYETRLNTLSNFATLYENLYKDGISELHFQAGLAENDLQRAFESAQKKQEALDKLAEQDIHEVKANGRVLLVDYKTGKTVADLGVDKTGSGNGGSNIQTDNERALLTQFVGLPIVKDYNTILAKKKSVDAIIQNGTGGPGDLSLVYEFMKALDPTSVVRETEYATAAKSGNIFLGALAKFNGYLKEDGGFLPDNVRSSFQSIINSKLQVQQDLYDNTVKQYQELATRQGLNPANVTIDFGAANTGQQTKYDPGTILISNNVQYLVGPDGETLTAIGSAL